MNIRNPQIGQGVNGAAIIIIFCGGGGKWAACLSVDNTVEI